MQLLPFVEQFMQKGFEEFCLWSAEIPGVQGDLVSQAQPVSVRPVATQPSPVLPVDPQSRRVDVEFKLRVETASP